MATKCDCGEVPTPVIPPATNEHNFSGGLVCIERKRHKKPLENIQKKISDVISNV